MTLSDGPAADVVSDVEADEGGAFPSDFSLSDLVPGTWTLTVEGYDGPSPDDAARIVAGSTEVSVSAGTNTSAAVTLSPIEQCEDGNCDRGTLSFTVTWPEEEDVERIAYTIAEYDAGGDLLEEQTLEDGAFDGPDEDSRYAATIEQDLDPGLYWVTVRFETGDGGSTWVAHELVYIRSNLTSAHTVNVSERTLTDVMTDTVEETISDDGNDRWESIDDGDGDYAYFGRGAGTLKFDAYDQDVTISFRVRNENINDTDPNDVTVTWFSDNQHKDDIDSQESAVEYPYTRARDDGEEILGSDYLEDESTLTDLGLDDEGFRVIEIDIDAGRYFSIEFQGGKFREYSFGDFEVEAR